MSVVTFKLMVSGLMVAALVGCGGGGGGTSTPTPTPTTITITGTVAKGAVLANAAIVAKCANALTYNTVSSSTGAYALTVPTDALPCLIQATSSTDTTVWRSAAVSGGSTAITPLTEMVVARVLRAMPSIAFTSYPNASAVALLTSVNVATAQADVRTALNGISDLSVIPDFIASPFMAATATSSGDAIDQALDRLTLALRAKGLNTPAVVSDLVQGIGLASNLSLVSIYTFTGTVTSPALTGDYATDAFNHTNYVRASLGLNKLNRVPSLDQAALSHSVYFATNGPSGPGSGGFHFEAGGVGFTGVTPTDRARAAGYLDSPVGEVMSIGSSSGVGASTGSIYVPYHRIGHLSDFADVGTGYSKGTWTMDFGGKSASWGPSENQLVVYPGSGQTDAPIGTFSDEIPNPLPDITPVQIGIPISVLGATGQSLRLNSISLTDSQGKDLPGRLVTINTESGAPLGNYGFLIPWGTEPTPNNGHMLKRNETYTAKAVGVYRGNSFTITWSFKTS